MPHSVTVRVPATSANLGAGFDCLGLALDLWATIHLKVNGGPSNSNRSIERMVLTAARRLFHAAGKSTPELEATYTGSIPFARGLGASALARVGGLLAANVLAGEPLQREQLLALASEMEGHADNAAPALFGGLQVVVREGENLRHVGLPVPPDLKAVLFIPDFHMPTDQSRELIPQSLSRADAVHNASRAALLVAAMAQRRFDLLAVATDDRLHQPARAKLFPAMYSIFEVARSAGAHCAYLSGGGSTICALTTLHEDTIAEAMVEAAKRREVRGQSLITAPTARGAEVVETE